MLFADNAPFLVAGHEPKDSKDSRDSVVRQTKMSLGSSLPPGLLAATRVTGFGQTSWPVLCAWVQGIVILAEPVFVAARMAFVDRVLLPVTFIIPLWQSFLLLLVIITLEKFLRVFFLLAAKWLLVGRYREEKHDIYRRGAEIHRWFGCGFAGSRRILLEMRTMLTSSLMAFMFFLQRHCWLKIELELDLFPTVSFPKFPTATRCWVPMSLLRALRC